MALIKKLIRFLQTDIWRIRVKKLPRSQSFWIKQLRIILLALRGYDEDRCKLHAASLTYFSILSVVPMVAMAFGLAKGFGFEKVLQKQLFEKFPGQEEVIGPIIGFAQSFLENTKGGVIAGIGVVVLFWSVIQILGNVENSLNEIWGIKKGRSLRRKFSDYLSIMLVGPFLLIISGSATVMITGMVETVLKKLSFLGVLGPAIFTALNFLPYVILWGLFTFIYMFIPFTKVKFRSAVIGGVIGGTMYQVVQWIYIKFQIGAANAGAIYGSFAALPLFLVWMQTSWRIVLFGAEISFAEQNVETYEFEPDCLNVSHAFKRLLTLRVVQLCVKNFHLSKKPWTATELVVEMEVPVRLLRQILFEATEAGILAEVRMENGMDNGYLPAFDVGEMTVARVNQILEDKGIHDIPVAASEDLQKLAQSLEDFRRQAEKSPENLLLMNM